MTKSADKITFLLNDEVVKIEEKLDPALSTLNFLRQTQRLIGTKEGCAEGDCGACTVVIGELVEKKLRLRAINACIQFIPTLDGKALYTVEYLKKHTNKLHPVQQALVDHHGSQCGFCTPGFVMSLWCTYVNHQVQQTRPSVAEIRTALSGNLCRCTGYRPIIDAGMDMLNYAEVEFDWYSTEHKLTQLQRASSLHYTFEDTHFHAPKTLAELTTLRSQKSDATLLAGSTDIGLWVNKQFRELGDIIYIGEVNALKTLEEDKNNLTIGAGVSLTDAHAFIAQHYPQIEQQWERFASTPIRNAGTLGGNIANGSPIGDSMPWLIALGAHVVLRSLDGQRTLLLEDLYLDYMQQDRLKDEIVERIILPKPTPDQIFRTYKISKRYDSDISSVCAAFSIRLDKNAMLTECIIAFGGMAATPKRASMTESKLIGNHWNEANAKQAMLALPEDYAPLSDMRASARNRLQTAQNLLYRFFLETRVENPVSAENLSVFSAAVN